MDGCLFNCHFNLYVFLHSKNDRFTTRAPSNATAFSRSWSGVVNYSFRAAGEKPALLSTRRENHWHEAILAQTERTRGISSGFPISKNVIIYGPYAANILIELPVRARADVINEPRMGIASCFYNTCMPAPIIEWTGYLETTLNTTMNS